MDQRDYYDGFLDIYAQNRKLMLETLPQLGFGDMAPPDGAFYIYTDISRYTHNSLDFCKRLLSDTGIATTPGIDFDPVNGHKFMRFSFPQSQAQVSDALERLSRWIKTEA
jgi:aspartate/methionine/tyrosine aminotransferase